MTKHGIKESLELVDLILSMADAIKQAKKDGVVNWFDLPKFAPVVIAAKKAIDGSEWIDEELKDLSAEEAQLIATAALSAGQALMEAIIKK
jgi:hypothetical protein